jgi:hypothetical protein
MKTNTNNPGAEAPGVIGATSRVTLPSVRIAVDLLPLVTAKQTVAVAAQRRTLNRSAGAVNAERVSPFYVAPSQCAGVGIGARVIATLRTSRSDQRNQCRANPPRVSHHASVAARAEGAAHAP